MIQVLIPSDLLATLDEAKKLFGFRSRGAVMRKLLSYDPFGILMDLELAEKRRHTEQKKQDQRKIVSFREFCDTKKITDDMLDGIATNARTKLE